MMSNAFFFFAFVSVYIVVVQSILKSCANILQKMLINFFVLQTALEPLYLYSYDLLLLLIIHFISVLIIIFNILPWDKCTCKYQ